MIPNASWLRRALAISCCMAATFLLIAAPASANPDCVKLVFQGKVQGRIEHCGCPKAPLGGLERRAAIMADIHESCEAVIAIDAGNMLGPIEDGMREQSAFLGAESARLGTRAVGIGAEDLHFGLEFLRELESKHGLQFSSANLRADGEPVFAPYLIQEANGLRVGIVSVLAPDAELVSEAGDLAGIEIVDPMEALLEVLPRLREQSDLIVLLSNLEQHGSRELARNLPDGNGVNFMIEGNSASHYGKAVNIHGIKLLAANPRGKYLGELSLGVHEGKWNGSFEFTEHEVDSRAPGEKAMAKRVQDFLDSGKMATGSK